MTRSPKVAREVPDLLESLWKHVKLLKEFSVRAFQDRDYDYLGEVAAKLRLLVYEGGRNKPLLITLMDELETDIRVKLGGPPIKPRAGHPGPGDEVSLREYLDLTAYGTQTPSKAFVQLTKKELINIWASQHGAAHEDWHLEEEFATARDLGLFIGGLPALAAELRVATETILHFAGTFLASLTPQVIMLKSSERQLKLDPNSIRAHHARGVALGQLGRYEEAIQEFEWVSKVDANHFRAQNNKALALQRLGRLSEAVKSYQRAIALNDNYADAHYNLACAYSLQGEFDRCLQELERVKGLDRFTGNIDPVADPDLENIRNDREYGRRFTHLIEEKGSRTR